MAEGSAFLRLVAVDQGAEDEALFAALMAGERDAGRRVWERYSPGVRRLIGRAFGPGYDVEDAVQEVFVRFLQCVSTLREPRKLKPFLMTLTDNYIKMEIRKKKIRRMVPFGGHNEGAEELASGDSTEAKLALIRFYRILDAMRASDRAVFVLRYMEGLSLKEIADALDISLATVKRRVSRAAERIMARIQNDPELSAYLGDQGLLENNGGEA